MKSKILFLIFFCNLLSVSLLDANPIEKLRKKGWEFELRAGVNIGGISPLPFPQEIREISKYNPKFNGQIGLVATNWLQKHWGVSLGLSFEQKGMESIASVKNYHIEIAQQGNKFVGNWTGEVRTAFAASYLSLPIQLVYRFNPRFRINGGIYFSYLFDGDFSGDIFNGYIRQGSSTGEKIEFGKETRTPYSFKDSLTSMEVGIKIGGSAKVYRQFLLFADMKCGFNNIFKGSFNAFPFKMYPVYLGTGFSYLF